MLFARPLVTDTKGESIYKVVENFFQEKEIPMYNIIACATDGAPAMVGRHRGFISYLKTFCLRFSLFTASFIENIWSQNILVVACTTHCISSLLLSIKSKLPHSRKEYFANCHKNETEFERLLLHTEVRWLSKGKCLSRFYSLLDTILEFLEEENPQLKQLVRATKSDVAYLADIYEKFNTMNLQLQGNLVSLVKCKTVVSSFIGN